MPDLFTALDVDWRRFTRSPAGTAALARWRSRQPILTSFTRLDTLVSAMSDRADPDERDRILLAVVRVAVDDHDARRAVLHVLTPGLRRVARTYQHRWGRADTASMTLTATLERLATYPTSRTFRPAANIVLDVQHVLHRAAVREQSADATLGTPQDLDVAEAEPHEPARRPADEVVELVAEAVRRGRLSAAQAELIVRQRVFDEPTRSLATKHGVQPGTIRKQRRRAEVVLAVAVA